MPPSLGAASPCSPWAKTDLAPTGKNRSDQKTIAARDPHFNVQLIPPLHPAIFRVDTLANLRRGIALLDHLRRIQRLVLAEVLSGRRVAVDETGKKSRVTHVPITLAVAIELIEHAWNLLSHLIGRGCFSDKEGWSKRRPVLPPHVAGRSGRISAGQPTRILCAHFLPRKPAYRREHGYSDDPAGFSLPEPWLDFLFSSPFPHDGPPWLPLLRYQKEQSACHRWHDMKLQSGCL